MSPVAIGLLAFGLALAGIMLGSAVHRTMPESQLSSDSKEVVKLSLGILATLAALVLGLLIASAKTTYSKSSIRRFKSFNQATTSNEASSRGSLRSP